MWTRSGAKRAAQEGGFSYELFASDGSFIERVGGFSTAQECDRAAEMAQRRALFPRMAEPIDDDISKMSLEELGRELGLE